MFLNRLNSLKELGGNWRKAVESIDNIIKDNLLENDSLQVNASVDTYKDMLVEAQLEQLKTVHSFKTLLSEKDKEVAQLVKRLKTGAPKTDESEEGLVAPSPSAHSETHWTEELEHQMRNNTLGRVEAVAQAREYKDTCRDLQRQLNMLRDHVRNQDAKMVQLESLESYFNSKKTSEEDALDKLALEYSKLSCESEAQRQLLADTVRAKAQMEEEMERMAKHVDLLMVPPAPPTQGDSSANDVARFISKDTYDRKIDELSSKVALLESDLADERNRCLHLSNKAAQSVAQCSSPTSHSPKATRVQKHLESSRRLLEAQLREAKENAERERESFQGKIAELERKVCSLVEQLEAARAQGETNECDGGTDSDVETGTAAQLELLSHERDSLTTELDQARSRCQSAEERLKEVETELARTRESYSETTSALEATLEITKERLESSRGDHAAALEAVAAEWQDKMDNLNLEVQAKSRKEEEEWNAKATEAARDLQAKLELHQDEIAAAVARATEEAETSKQILEDEYQSQLQALSEEHKKAISALQEGHQNQMHSMEEQLASVEASSRQKQLDADASHLKEMERLRLSHAETLQIAQQAAEEARASLVSAHQEEIKRIEATFEATLKESHERIAELQSECAAAHTSLAKMKSQAEDDRKEALAALRVKLHAEKELAVETQRQKMQDEVDENRHLYVKESTLRKRVHNELMDLKGNIRVFCRVRPVLPAEMRSGNSGRDVTEYPFTNEIVVSRDDTSQNRFEFDSVFPPKTSQELVFDDISPLVTSVLDGYNVCIFAYGQTGSGKTYTMEGTQEDPGVNSRALSALFAIQHDRRADEDLSFSISVLEIYNESVHDLLASKQQGTKQSLDLRLGSDGKVFVQGLEEVGVESMSDVLAAMKRAQGNRAVGAHNMNEHSSRSHLVLTVNTSSVNKISKAKARGSLNLIDLAGSERVGKTDATGSQLKEAQNINKSLSALGDVIAALGQGGKSKQTHIPYRNSKLTHLLQNSLGGDSKVAMFVNISPAQYNASETICSLNFASRCRKTQLGAAKKTGSNADAVKYKKQIASLKSQLAAQSRTYDTSSSAARKPVRRQSAFPM